MVLYEFWDNEKNVMRSASDRIHVNTIPIPEAATAPHSPVLVIGEGRKWRAATRDFKDAKDIEFANFRDLSPDLLDRVHPDVVLSPLLSGSFDCLDLAVILGSFGFKGRYRVVAPRLPNPEMIRSEVLSCCPRVDFGILFLGSGRQLVPG